MIVDPELFSQSSYQLATALTNFEAIEHVEFVQIAEGDEDRAVTTRELFCEIVTVGLGNLYNKIPLPAPLFDPKMLSVVLSDLEDAEVTQLMNRTEEWLRYEGLVRIMAGERNQYVLTSPAISILSISTSEGSIGMQLTRSGAC